MFCNGLADVGQPSFGLCRVTLGYDSPMIRLALAVFVVALVVSLATDGTASDIAFVVYVIALVALVALLVMALVSRRRRPN